MPAKSRPPRTGAPILERGDRVAVVAPGFAVPHEALDAGIARLRRMGFDVCEGRALREREGYFAGDDASRLADLSAALRDPAVRAVWFARGGYGTARLLDRLPWRAMRAAPKALIGYSDLTALFNPLLSRSAATCLYGPVVSELGERTAWDRRSLADALAGRPYELRVRRRDVLAAGRGEGRLFGGNLSVLVHLLGTRWFPDLEGAVLFIEEVGEAIYRVDRMLNQLRQSGALASLAAVLLGGFATPPRRRFPPDRALDDVLAETFLPLGVPVLRGLPAGHVAAKRTLPLGWNARVDGAAGRVRFSP